MLTRAVPSCRTIKGSLSETFPNALEQAAQRTKDQQEAYGGGK